MNTTARAANPSEPPHGILPDEVFDPILRIAHVLNKAVGRLLHPYRMSCSDASVLAVLHRSGPPHALAPTDIARCLALTSGALTPGSTGWKTLAWSSASPCPQTADAPRSGSPTTATTGRRRSSPR